MIKILLCGYSGAMGTVIQTALPDDMQIVAGVSKELEHKDFETVLQIDAVGIDCDVIVDFSHVSLLESVLDFAVEKKKPLIIASTGITDELCHKIEKAAQTIPIVQSGNYSLGVYAVQEAVRNLAAILDDYDLEIIEKHHRYKKDAPSGTAKMLFEALKDTRQDLYAINGREGQYASKPLNELSYHSLRAGTIVGEHCVLFAGEDEVVEIKHQAYSKKIFAMGAFKAIRYILKKTTGRYTLKDVIENA